MEVVYSMCINAPMRQWGGDFIRIASLSVMLILWDAKLKHMSEHVNMWFSNLDLGGCMCEVGHREVALR